MALDYDVDMQLKGLTEISSEYLEWFLSLGQSLFYPHSIQTAHDIKLPDSFEVWLKEAQNANFIDEQIIVRIIRRHNELLALSNEQLRDAGQAQKLPNYDDYAYLVDTFMRFMDHIKRIEKDMIASQTGVDTFTGLRTSSVMKADLGKEMQRLARQDRPFSVALIRIDYFEYLQKELSEEGLGKHIQNVAGLIKRSLRPFDDAYYTGPGEFILSLKLADVSGGIKALERLKVLLENAQIVIETQERGSVQLSLSCCVAEPLEGDDLDELIRDLRKDLAGIEKSEDTVFQYLEMSPLERFVQDQS